MFYSLLLAKCLVYGGCVSMEMTTLWLFLVCATRASQHSCEADHMSSDGVGTHADYTAQDYLDSNRGGVFFRSYLSIPAELSILSETDPPDPPRQCKTP